MGKLNNSKLKKLINMVLFAVVLLIIYITITYVPINQIGLSIKGRKMIALMEIAIFIWIFEIIPLSVSALLITVLQVPLNLLSLEQAIGNFAQPIFLFILGCFFLSTGMKNSGITKRITVSIIKLSKSRPKFVLLYMMIFCSIASMFISDLAVTAMIFPIAKELLENNELKPGKSNFGKTLMMGIPFSALIGGIGTPAGATMNYIAIDLVRKYSNINISFSQWASFGIPIVLFLIPIAYIVLINVFKPEAVLLNYDSIYTVYTSYDFIKEVKFIVVFLILVAVWFSGKFDLAISTFIIGSLFFLPSIDINDSQTISRDIDWNIVIFCTAVSGLGTSIVQLGIADWLAVCFTQLTSGFNYYTFIINISIFIVLVHLIIPVNIAIATIFIPIVIKLSSDLCFNPSLVILPVTYLISCSILLPLDSVPLLTYSARYFRFHEMFIPGLFISIFWIIIQTIVFSIAYRLAL